MKKGWQTKKLSALYQIGSSKRVLKSQWKTEGVPFYRGREVTRLAADGLVDNELFISEEHFAELSKQTGVPQAGDIVLTAIGTIGNSHVVQNNDRFYFKDASVLWMKRTAEVSSEFINLWFKSPCFFDQLDRGNGATVDTLTIQKLQSVQIELPPLPEQQRIVGLLDEAFYGIAIAKANAEKNLHNARAIFESDLQSVFTQRGKGWEEKRLADIAEFKNGLNFTRQSKGQTLRMVGVGDFQEHSIVPIETLQSVTIDGELADDYLIRRDDILTVRSNGSRDLVGRCMLVPDVDGMTSFSGFIIRIRFNTHEISPRFLLHFMRSSETRKRLTRDGGGANISNINQAKLSELPISLPSLKQQEDIAKRLDHLRQESQRLASIYQRKLAALEGLQKSLLHQAFAGRLKTAA
jgi:type I restriction enzyme S subunit